MTQKSQKDSKNSTSTTTKTLIVMLEKMPYTWGKKYERSVNLYTYSPTDSSFELYEYYSRLRDCYRGVLRLAQQHGTNFSVVYLKS